MLRLCYISYGVLTPTRAHNLQIVHTINALVRCGASVDFINPELGESAQARRLRNGMLDNDPPTSTLRNIPGSGCFVIRTPDFYRRYIRNRQAGRYWFLFLDRSLFAIKALRRFCELPGHCVVTRDVVVCFWFLVLRRWIGVPVIYELHTLEQVMFGGRKQSRPSSPRPEDLDPSRISLRPSAFAGDQVDSSLPGKAYKWFLTRLENWTIRRADTVMALTRTLAKRLERELGIQPPVVVSSGHTIDSAPAGDKLTLRRSLRLPPNRKIAIYSGLSFHGKGVDLLFDVAGHLPPDCSILLLGGEPEQMPTLKSLWSRRKLGDRMILAPSVVQSRVVDYLCAADVGLLCYPATPYLARFSSPLKLFEYLACGLPVVATDLPATREVVIHGWNGVLVDSQEPAYLASAIAGVMHDRAALERMGQQALADSTKYHHRQRARRIIEIIGNCRRNSDSACT